RPRRYSVPSTAPGDIRPDQRETGFSPPELRTPVGNRRKVSAAGSRVSRVARTQIGFGRDGAAVPRAKGISPEARRAADAGCRRKAVGRCRCRFSAQRERRLRRTRRGRSPRLPRRSLIKPRKGTNDFHRCPCLVRLLRAFASAIARKLCEWLFVLPRSWEGAQPNNPQTACPPCCGKC